MARVPIIETMTKADEPTPASHSGDFSLDPAILGQIMTAENILATLPTDKKIAEFTVGVFGKVPGLSTCQACIRGITSAPGRSRDNSCRDCRIDFENPDADPHGKCVLHEGTNSLSIALRTASSLFGFLHIGISNSSRLNPYIPFVKSFCNQIALHLENRHQRAVLQSQSEKTLQYERDLIQGIMETSPAGIVRLDAGGNVVYANKRAQKILGLKKSDIAARTYNDPAWKITDFDGKEFPTENLPFVIVKKTEKPVFGIQHAIEWPHGERVLLIINAAPLFNHEGGFDGVVATIDDITDKYQTEQNYQMLFREMIDGFALHEITCNDEKEPVDYRFLAVNPSFERLTGLKADQIIDRSVLEVMPETEPYWIERYGKVALTGTPMEFENYSRELDRYFQVTAFQPAPNQFACIFSDITERKQSEVALRESHERFLAVLDGIEASIFVADMKTHEILFMNKSMINAFHGDFTGKKCFEKLRGEKEPCNFCANKHLIAGNGVPDGVSVWEDKNPITGAWYINHIRAIKWTDGRMVRIQIATDITEMREMGNRLRQAQKMEAIGTLAGGIAHDFNNILTSIIGFTEIGIDVVEKNSLLEDSLKEIYVAGSRAKDLVKQILAFARKSEEEIKPVQPGLIVKEVARFLRSSIPTTIEIKLNVHSDSFIMANATQIHQVLMNICTNASHAMEDKGGLLEIRLRDVTKSHAAEANKPDLKDGNYLELVISDTGVGIPAESVDSIFDPYYTTKAVGEGTGLGLAVVHGIVETYGGMITVDSVFGEGTTFTIYLPILDKHKKEREYRAEGVPSGSERVLLVDDEPSITKMCGQILERLGYEVTAENSSMAALEIFRSKPEAFDLLVTDMTMPEMTGDTLAMELMRIRPDIPVILCTGFTQKMSNETALDLGIKAFVNKPIDKADLAKIVRKVLDENSGYQPPAATGGGP